MTYTELLAVIDPEPTRQLNNAIAEKVLTEKQLMRVFNVHLAKAEIPGSIIPSDWLQTAAKELGFVLDRISSSRLSSFDPVGYKRLLTRLQSDSAQDAINEILCHTHLHTVFKNYIVAPLFGDSSDGYIETSQGIVPVEIKSRFPEIFPRLTNFFEQVFSFIPTHVGLDIELDFLITEITNFTANDATQELLEVKNALSALDLAEVQFISGLIYKSRSKAIKYEAHLVVRPVPLEARTYVPIKGNQDEFLLMLFSSSFLFQEQNKSKMDGYRLTRVVLADPVKQYLSSILINECLRRGKNIPKDWGLFAIYSHYDTSPIKKFIDQCVRNYLFTHPGLGIITASIHFPSQNPALRRPSIWAGTKISGALTNSYLFPEAIVITQKKPTNS